jgi:hypothetical protein
VIAPRDCGRPSSNQDQEDADTVPKNSTLSPLCTFGTPYHFIKGHPEQTSR